jgi:ATP-dependent protease ClpP protease subunit
VVKPSVCSRVQNPAKVAKDMERPLYMRPEEAIAYGLADHVRTPSYPVAYLAYKHFDSPVLTS